MSAAAKASLVANRWVCGNTTINIEKAKLLLDESFSSSRTEGMVNNHCCLHLSISTNIAKALVSSCEASLFWPHLITNF